MRKREFEEQWVDIKGFEGLYQISNFGRVKSFAKGNKQRLLSKRHDSKGYETVVLYKEKAKYAKKVHRLVAEAFLDNSFSKRQVNHIDGIKTHNSANNLEWCTQEENINHAYRTGLKTLHSPRKVVAIKNGEVICCFDSIVSAGKFANTFPQNISKCCSGKRNKCAGYEWKYE